MSYKVDLNIVECYQKKNLCYINAYKNTCEGIIRHNTGAGNKYLKRYVDDPDNLGKNKYGNHWNQKQTGSECKMVHYFIGLDKNDVVKIYHVLPDNYKCWGNGKHPSTGKSCNATHIQYEICDDKFQDKDYFEATHKAARYLEAYLCKKHGLTEKDIMSHWESYLNKCGSAHGDDDDWLKKFGTNMDGERKLVKALLKEDESEAKEEKQKTSDKDKTISANRKRFIKSLKSYYNNIYKTKLDVNEKFDSAFKAAIKARNIKKGSPDKLIEHCQYWLKKQGYKGADGKTLKVDGKYGKNTNYAFLALQKKLGLKQDAIFGTRTIEAWIKTL